MRQELTGTTSTTNDERMGFLNGVFHIIEHLEGVLVEQEEEVR